MKMKKTFTDKEVKEFLKESNAIEGVYSDIALEDALRAWEYLKLKSYLTPEVILATHHLLMRNISPEVAGFFRKQPVWIGGREAFKSSKIEEAIGEWLGDVHTSIDIPGKDGKHIRLDHITYEEIHPFLDGNGRTGRLFMNWERLKAGLPILIIHEGEEQLEYYKWFE